MHPVNGALGDGRLPLPITGFIPVSMHKLQHALSLADNRIVQTTSKTRQTIAEIGALKVFSNKRCCHLANTTESEFKDEESVMDVTKSTK